MATRAPRSPTPPPPAPGADGGFSLAEQANCFVDFSFAFCGKRDTERETGSPRAAGARVRSPSTLFGDAGTDYEDTDHLVDDEIPMSYVCAPNC